MIGRGFAIILFRLSDLITTFTNVLMDIFGPCFFCKNMIQKNEIIINNNVCFGNKFCEDKGYYFPEQLQYHINGILQNVTFGTVLFFIFRFVFPGKMRKDYTIVINIDYNT